MAQRFAGCHCPFQTLFMRVLLLFLALLNAMRRDRNLRGYGTRGYVRQVCP